MAPDAADGRFTPGELRLATWWVQNRLRLRRLGYGVLIAIAALLWLYVIWGLLDAYVISYPRESRYTRQVALNQQLLTALATDTPQNVSLTDVSVFQATGGRYDLAVDVTNPNPQWWAEFTYSFDLSGEQTPQREGYVLPGSSETLTELGYTPKSKGGTSATLVVQNVRWHRIDPSVVGASYTDFAAKRFNLSFENVSYDTNITLGTQPLGQSTFTLVNDSAYGFWNVDLIIRLYRGSTVVAISKLGITDVQPGEHRTINKVWTSILPGITKTEIIPQVDLLDPSVYLPTTKFVGQ